MTARLGRVHLRVEDLDRAVRFYTKVVGLRVYHRTPAIAYLSSADAGHELALHAHRAEGPPPPISLGCRFVGFEVPSKAALAAACDRLGGARAVVVDTGDSWSIHTTDPDGNGVEIYCDTRGEGSGASAGVARTMSLSDLRAAASVDAVR